MQYLIVYDLNGRIKHAYSHNQLIFYKTIDIFGAANHRCDNNKIKNNSSI